MDDNKIVELFWRRDEQAIQVLSQKYQSYGYKIAWNLLKNKEDTEECLNDAWFAVWSCVPPQKPKYLPAFVGRIIRRIAIDRIRKKTAEKRIDTHMADVLTEMDALSISYSLDEALEEKEMMNQINHFLERLSEKDRDIFVRRYWFMDSIGDIAERHGVTTGSIRMNLYRNRKKLWKKLRKDGHY